MLGKSQAEEIHSQVMEEVGRMKLRRGNQPRLRERIVQTGQFSYTLVGEQV